MFYRRQKYHNQPTVYNGVTYISKSEALYAQHLDRLIKGKSIKAWKRQVKMEIGPDDSLKVDFLVYDLDGGTFAVDVKGFETGDFKRKCKLWAKYQTINLHIAKWKNERWHIRIIEGMGSTNGGTGSQN